MNLEEKLRASIPTSEPPPFMHTRIMNSVKASGNAESRACGRALRFYAALTFVTTIVIAIALIPRTPKPQQLAVAIEIPDVPQITLPPNTSLQQEMENLKADTRNAARALSASFLPTQP